MAHFFILLLHFVRSLVAKKARIYGETVRYNIVIIIMALYGRKWRLFTLQSTFRIKMK